MDSKRNGRWTSFLAIILLFGCGDSPGKEPVYQGKPLREWVMMTEDQGFDLGPSAEAKKAAQAVRAIGVTNCIPFLVHWIQPPWEDSRLLGGAVECFRIFGVEAKSAIPQLAKILNKPATTLDQISSQSEAAKALSFLGPDALPAMLSAINNAHGQQSRWEMIDDLANFRTNGTAALPAVLTWSQDPDYWVRLGCLHAYIAIETNSTALMKYVLSAMKDPNDLVRRDAAEVLGYIAKGNKDALPVLKQALQDPDWQVRSGAITGLGMIGVDPKVVVPLLAEKLQDQNWILRRVAANALGNVGGKEAFDVLMTDTDDPNGFVREIVFKSLNRIDPDALKRTGKTFSNSGKRHTQ